jgi:prepilin-type N-terminal cleavage/methylation domain-containing protein
MSRKRIGFSLMELMVVVAILAVLAGLVISKIDYARRDANMAAGALSCGDVAQNIQLYLAMTEKFPAGLDTLLNSTDHKLYSGPTTANGTGGIIGITDGVGNIPSQTTPTAVSGKALNSLFRVGVNFVNDNNPGASNASDSGTAAVSLGSTSPTGTTLATNVNLLLANTGSALWTAAFPANVWPSTNYTDGVTMTVDPSGKTVQLVCLGIGPGNAMNGISMMSPPQYPGPDSNVYYYRYVALFAIYSDGSRAQLKGVVDPFGRTIDSSLQQYSTSGPDNLPPGSRAPE